MLAPGMFDSVWSHRRAQRFLHGPRSRSRSRSPEPEAEPEPTGTIREIERMRIEDHNSLLCREYPRRRETERMRMEDHRSLLCRSYPSRRETERMRIEDHRSLLCRVHPNGIPVYEPPGANLTDDELWALLE